VSDWALLAYAAWTVLAYFGMATGTRVSVLVAIWLVTVPLTAVAVLLLRGRASGPAPERRLLPLRLPDLSDARRRYVLAAGLALAVASAALAGILEQDAWSLVWATGFLALVFVLGAIFTSPGPDEDPAALAGRLEHLFAALTAFLLGAMSLFVNRLSADDVFYINRATATAQLDRIPVRDVLVTDEKVLPASGVGLPVDSFSALQGALARLVHVSAPSVAYYVSPPLFTFLGVWALWRVLRLWAPRAVSVCFALGIVFLLFSAQFNLTPGSFFLSRMWQGKVIFVAWLVPTLYVLLTRWLTRADAITGVLLVAAGVTSIGLTGSATFAAPLVFATAGLWLLIRREWKPLLVVVCAAAIPFIIGFAATRRYGLSDLLGGSWHKTPWFFHSVFGIGLVCAIGLLALLIAPLVVRRGSPLLVVAGIGMVAAVLLAPEVLPVLSDVTGVQGALRRTLWVVPLPALVGLLAALPVGEWVGKRWAVAVPAAAAAALLIALGKPLWESNVNPGRTYWTAPPSWKLTPRRVADARAILGRYDGPGPILAEEPIMAAIAEITVDPKAVNPRRWYIKLTGEPRSTKAERLRLTAFVTEKVGDTPRPTLEQARHDLAHLGVDLVCVDSSEQELLRAVQVAGPYEPAFKARGQTCFSRSGGAG
jgi:Family of unknown function (DUF6077)